MFSKLKKIPLQLGKQYVFKAAVLSLGAIALFMGLKTYFENYITVTTSLDGRELPIYCVETDKKQVALSFDAAWGNEDTPKILEILKKYNLQVTFFMTGGWVDAYPEDVKAIAAAGHDLGNHSENHKNMSQISAEECEQELMTVHERVKTLTGKDMTLFRPPYGDYSNHVIQTASKCNYLTVQWDVDTYVTELTILPEKMIVCI